MKKKKDVRVDNGRIVSSVWTMGWRYSPFSLFLLLLLLFFSATSLAQKFRYASNAAGRWSTSTTIAMITNTTAGWALLPFLFLNTSGPTFACGLLCLRRNYPGQTTNPCDDSTILFGVFLVVGTGINSLVATDSSPPVVVWSANRNFPITHPATLSFTETELLQLDSGDGTPVQRWENISYISLTDEGNLVLYKSRDSGLLDIEWQSFDHPTDTALAGQSLSGKQLVANTSAENPSEGFYLLNVTNTTFTALVEVPGHPSPQVYYSSDANRITSGILLQTLVLKSRNKTIVQATTFVRLEANGQLRSYKWSDENLLWQPRESLIEEDYRSSCMYPMVCGEYGYCYQGDCSCSKPSEKIDDYFKQLNPDTAKDGCQAKTALTCEGGRRQKQQQQLVDYGSIAFYGYAGTGDILATNVDTCKTACERNCSCKGAFFKYGTNKSNGDCYLPSVILTFTKNNWTLSNYNSSSFLKVVIPPDAPRASPESQGSRRNMVPIAIGVIAACVACLAGIVCVVFILARRRRLQKEEEEEGMEFEFTHLPGMPTRFTYEELRSATTNFSRKLGQGGFGAVFHGMLSDGMEIAVKVLGYNGQGMKEFLAEVETIGSIHHVNLVRLVGYCADRLHRLLVYEFLSNGSLERWIFSAEGGIDWPTKCKIITDVARGLSYLHEECRHKIIHLDIKPQNILLDDKFNAKVSDFGLSKLVDRDQSQVVTTLRGTPGYMAPEWLSSTITEKVDVYSFGVVVLEMVSGKRVMDNSRSQGSLNLLSHLRKLAQEDRLLDIVAEECRGMEEVEEALRMVKIAVWCLQGDCNKRPSMSVVSKVLEKMLQVEENLDYNFLMPSWVAAEQATSSSTPFLASLPSGPR